MPDDVQSSSQADKTIDFSIWEHWIELWNFFKHKPELIQSDPQIAQAVNNYENLFFSNLNDSLDNQNTFDDLEIFYILHKRKLHILSQDRLRVLIRNMVAILKEQDLHKAYKLATNCKEDDLCQQTIREYENKFPKKIPHSQSKFVQIVQNQNIRSIDCRRSLFKSQQEKDFFDAVRDVYPQFIVYPNVAMSSILDFEGIKDFLSPPEKNYFFMAIIDCVVFDYHQLYMPKYFFEIDSLFHDDPIQITKDSYKNKIFSVAGQKLHRIRSIGNYQGRIDFTKLIREILNSTE